MNQPININLSVTPAGAELIVKALRAVTPLPDPNIDGFVAELWAQYQTQMQAAMAPKKAEAPTPSPDTEDAASAPSDPVPATETQGE